MKRFNNDLLWLMREVITFSVVIVILGIVNCFVPVTKTFTETFVVASLTVIISILGDINRKIHEKVIVIYEEENDFSKYKRR